LSKSGRPKVLFLSGSIGLGHVIRDLAIANELRKLKPEIDIDWLGGEPAASFLRTAGERVLPESEGYSGEAGIAETMVDGYRLNLAKYLVKANQDWKESWVKYQQLVEKGNYDFVVGDEAWAPAVGYGKDPTAQKQPFILMTDFEKCTPVTRSPMDRLVIWMQNRAWDKPYKRSKKGKGSKDYHMIFIGELEDVPDEKLGLFMSNARDVASQLEFVGYALPFHPSNYADVMAQKRKLGYGKGELIICSIGGTSAGKNLLELCGKAFQSIKARLPDSKMMVVTGPRLKPEQISVPDDVEVRGYVPNLYEHFAACDLAIVQAGGTTTLELTALKRPFIYFPMEEHWEQLGTVVPRLKRHRAGVEMRFYQTSPQQLADAVIQNISKKIEYADVPVEGARKAAEAIVKWI
jgi:predicted glycosyltransferase